jgi:hypothetical protein
MYCAYPTQAFRFIALLSIVFRHSFASIMTCYTTLGIAHHGHHTRGWAITVVTALGKLQTFSPFLLQFGVATPVNFIELAFPQHSFFLELNRYFCCSRGLGPRLYHASFGLSKSVALPFIGLAFTA